MRDLTPNEAWMLERLETIEKGLPVDPPWLEEGQLVTVGSLSAEGLLEAEYIRRDDEEFDELNLAFTERGRIALRIHRAIASSAGR